MAEWSSGVVYLTTICETKRDSPTRSDFGSGSELRERGIFGKLWGANGSLGKEKITAKFGLMNEAVLHSGLRVLSVLGGN